MSAQLDATTIQGFAIACLIGALIGLEREKHRTTDNDPGSPGLRTFIIVAEIGALAGWLARVLSAPWIIGAALGAVALGVVAGYVVAGRRDPAALGLTTEFAALVVCLLGAVATLGQSPLAIGLGVVTAAVLAYKQSLHGLVARLGWDDVYAGVRLLIAAFIVLPLLPDRPIDPWGALNPYSLWQLVLLIAGLSLVGYVATRWLGETKGTLLTGITGGLVSSTAVTLSFARSSREAEDGAGARTLASGILISWAVMFARVVVLVFVVNPALVARVLVPFAAMAIVATIWAWGFVRSAAAAPRQQAAGDVPLQNPFSLTSAAKFAALFALILVMVKVAQRQFSNSGLYAVAGLAGLVDVDVITLSMAQEAKAGDAGAAMTAIVIAVLTNTLVKAGMTAVLGSEALRPRVLLATAVVLVSGLAGAWLGWG
jgi:uncharacterized membrane protein (DUF4010 family)